MQTFAAQCEIWQKNVEKMMENVKKYEKNGNWWGIVMEKDRLVKSNDEKMQTIDQKRMLESEKCKKD